MVLAGSSSQQQAHLLLAVTAGDPPSSTQADGTATAQGPSGQHTSAKWGPIHPPELPGCWLASVERSDRLLE